MKIYKRVNDQYIQMTQAEIDGGTGEIEYFGDKPVMITAEQLAERDEYDARIRLHDAKIFIEMYRGTVGDDAPITVGGVTVRGDSTTRAAIAETIKFWEELPEEQAPETIDWQGLPDGNGGYHFYSLTLEQLKALGVGIGLRRQKSFSVKKYVLDALALGSIATRADAKDLFDAGMSA